MRVNKLVLERESQFVDVNIKIESCKDELLSLVFLSDEKIYLYSFLEDDRIDALLTDSGLNIISKEQISIYSEESITLCLDMMYESIITEPVYLSKCDMFNNINLN